MIVLLLLCAGSSIGQSDTHQRSDNALLSGLVLARFKSSQPLQNGAGVSIQYQILKVIRQPFGKTASSKQTAVTEIYPPNESQLPLSLQVDEEYSGKIFMLEVSLRSSGFVVKQRWPIATEKDQQLNIIANESSGSNDVEQIESRMTGNEKASKFADLASTTKTPSLALVLEAWHIIKSEPAAQLRGHSDTQYFELVQGLMHLFARPDTPAYVRPYAFYAADGLKLINDDQETKRQRLVASTLMQVFHRIMPATGSSRPFADFILQALAYYLHSALISADTRQQVAQFSQDLQLLNQVVSTPGSGDPTTSEQTKQLIRPLLDMLKIKND